MLVPDSDYDIVPLKRYERHGIESCDPDLYKPSQLLKNLGQKIISILTTSVYSGCGL